MNRHRISYYCQIETSVRKEGPKDGAQCTFIPLALLYPGQHTLGIAVMWI